jgi:periplasmic protein TonB
VDAASGAGADDVAVLETAVPSGIGVRRITVKLRYDTVRALRECLTAPANAESSWPTGLLYGSMADGIISIESAAVAGGMGTAIGLFRGQPGGWATLTDADRKKLKSAGIPHGLVLVVRTLSRRPWSATLFEPEQPETETAAVEFPLDEYVLRQGWLLDTPAPLVQRAPAPRRRGLRGWEVAAAVVLLASGEALYWQAHRGGGTAKPATAQAPAAPVERRLGLQTWRNGEDVEISWNRMSDAVRRATVGTLTIRNGPLMRVVAMRPDELRENRVLFHPLAGTDMELRLEVMDSHGASQVDSLELLGSSMASDLRLAEAEPEPAPEPVKPPPPPEAPRPRSASRRSESAAGRGAARRIQTVKAEVPAKPANRGPLIIRRARPEITPKVLREMQQAKGRVTVSVQVSIDSAGKVDGAMVLSSTGEPSPSGPYIRLASLDAARQWRFEPAIRSGNRVPSKTTLVFDF